MLWGRSMGAATAILYAAKYKHVDGLVLDSSFSDLESLMIEIADAQITLPEFLVRFCM
jgi:alpha-beta hydrolase superfamily lysophospholipase